MSDINNKLMSNIQLHKKQLVRFGFYSVACVLFSFFLLTSCYNSPSTEKNWFSLSKGETIEYNTTTFFIKINSEVKWELSVAYEGDDTGWCNLSKTSGVSNATITATTSVNKGSDRSLLFTVDFDGSKKKLRLTQEGESSAWHDENFIGAWNELPYFNRNNNNSDIKVVTHYVPDKKGMRNFTICYDTENHYPVWVAYPMHKVYYPSGGRPDPEPWNYDPKISKNMQPRLYSGMGNNHDRGHMLPSASRYINKAANAQTFYFTNISMQKANLNRYVWANLEDKVRKWGGESGSRDTLYVVTGAVLRTVGGNETVRKDYSRSDPDKTMMAVPNYFYKALVKSWSNGNYRGIAFWFTSAGANREVLASDAISIKELEEKTGVNFFVNLPSDVKAKVKEEFDPALWGLK